MKVLQVSTYDVMGGAEGIAFRLFEAYRRLGHDSWLAVGTKLTQDPGVLLIPKSEPPKTVWYEGCEIIARYLRSLIGSWPGVERVCRLLDKASRPMHWLRRECGWEDFDAPGTRQLLRLPPRVPDLIHCHNLHGILPNRGFYFDLRALPWLSHKLPVVMTLHDAWLTSGHCAHSFACERWKTGCGSCPDLSIEFPLRRDGTAYNWLRKRSIFLRSRLFIATPSRWLMNKVEQSILAPAIRESRVIPNGIDLSVFHPADRRAVRAALGISPDAKVLLFAANGVRVNMWKDFRTMREAVRQAAERVRGERLLFVALGESAPPEQIGAARIIFIPKVTDPHAVASYYQAADLYLHAAHADTFPTTVLEALACGTPVIATAVGGIPEQIRTEGDGPGATGVLVPPGDAAGMAGAIERLLRDDAARRRMGERGAQDARSRFDQRCQVETYVQWYNDILTRERGDRSRRPPRPAERSWRQ